MAYRVLAGFDVKKVSDPNHFRRVEPGTVLEEDDLDVSPHASWMLDDGMLERFDPEEEAAEDEASDHVLTKGELQDLCRANDLPVSGTKDQLIERLREAGVEGV